MPRPGLYGRRCGRRDSWRGLFSRPTGWSLLPVPARFRLLGAAQQERLFANIASSMQGVPAFIIDRQLTHFDRADPAYGAGVRKALKARGIAFTQDAEVKA